MGAGTKPASSETAVGPRAVHSARSRRRSRGVWVSELMENEHDGGPTSLRTPGVCRSQPMVAWWTPAARGPSIARRWSHRDGDAIRQRQLQRRHGMLRNARSCARCRILSAGAKIRYRYSKNSNSWKDRCEAFRGCEPLRNSHVLACKLRIPARHEKSKTVADQ